MFPNEIVIELTNKCNLDCSFCFNKSGGDELPKQDVFKIIDDIRSSGIHAVRFSGGEPLLRADLQEILDYSKGLYVILNTNAHLAKVPIISNLFIVSLHSRKYFDIIPGKLKFLQGKVMLATIATKKNIENLEDYYSFVSELEITEWFILRPIPNENETIGLDNIKTLAEKIRKLNAKYSMDVKIANAIPFCSVKGGIADISKGGFFDSGYSRIIIDSRGNYKTDYYSEKILGNIKENSVMEIWNSDYLKNIKNFKFIHKTCRECRFLEPCKGGLIKDGEPIDVEFINPDNLNRKVQSWT